MTTHTHTHAQLVAMNDKPLAGAPFDVAMDAMIALEGPDVEFTFFRGTTDELKELAGECSLVQHTLLRDMQWRAWLSPRTPKQPTIRWWRWCS